MFVTKLPDTPPFGCLSAILSLLRTETFTGYGFPGIYPVCNTFMVIDMSL
jgi:hypothetical protein